MQFGMQLFSFSTKTVFVYAVQYAVQYAVVFLQYDTRTTNS